MKKLQIKILEQYKLYKKGAIYNLEGDLILLSGVNGSGKSQRLKIIANNGKDKISRQIIQTNAGGNNITIENIMLLSFRDNINLGNDFGHFSVTCHKNYAENAWGFYSNNVKYNNNNYMNEKKKKRINEEYLKTNSKAEQRSEVLLFYKKKDKHKKSFWKDLLVADKSHFEDFRPLFAQIERIFSEG